MSPDQIGFALLYLGVFMLIGKWLRVHVNWMQNLFLPSALIAGFLALLIGPEVLGRVMAQFVGDDNFWTTGVLNENIVNVWETLPGLMINIIFAALFLGKELPSLKNVWRVGGPQLAFGWTVGWGQYVIGIGLVALLLSPFFGIPPSAGALIEIGFEGGHGTAAGMKGTFEDIGFAGGYDLAVALATVGVLSGVIVGIILINWGVRRQKTQAIKDVRGFSKLRKQGIMEQEENKIGADITVRPESIEPMALHFGFIALAVLIGFLIQKGLVWLEALTWGAATGSDFMTYIPLFPLAMIGGIILQAIVDKLGWTYIVDRAMINRIQGFALDVLVLSAVGTVSLDIIGEYFVPFLVLSIAGIGWNVFAFLVFAKRMIPDYWFERGIGDFGQSTGITATGLMLLRVVDPDNQTPAFEAFGYKQLIYEPFLGGGLVTALSVPLIFEFGPWPFFIISVAMSLLGLAFGLFYFGRKRK